MKAMMLVIVAIFSLISAGCAEKRSCELVEITPEYFYYQVPAEKKLKVCDINSTTIKRVNETNKVLRDALKLYEVQTLEMYKKLK